MNNENRTSSLPKAALDEIPTPDPDAVSITGLVKSRGRISGYQLSDDRIVSREEGVSLAKAGKIKGVGVALNLYSHSEKKYLHIVQISILPQYVSFLLQNHPHIPRFFPVFPDDQYIV